MPIISALSDTFWTSLTSSVLLETSVTKKFHIFVHSDILRRIIVEQIASMMVLPNKLPITLSDEVPATVLKMPEPEVCIQ
jgi:hypothetical protein